MTAVGFPITHRSKRSNDQAFIRFKNTTEREVTIIWLDYDGNKVPYANLVNKDSFVDINTYTNHPWIFEDLNNGDKFVINHNEVYYPESWKSEIRKIIAHTPRNEIRRPRRKLLLITHPLHSLRNRALQVIRDCLEKPEDSFALEIPHTIQSDIYRLMQKKGNS